jgi:nucleoside-diphosphate-sugar epimerase
VATSVLDLAAALFRATGREPAVEFAPKRPGEQQDSSLDIEKIERAFGWRPRVSLEQGLADTFAWFAAREKTPAEKAAAATT